MLSILIVEDEVNKRSALCDAIREFDAGLLDATESVTDVHAARKILKRKKFDLLILDINIPCRMEEKVRIGGGLEVLQFIRDNDAAIPPTAIIGMTAYDEGIIAAGDDVTSPIWKLIKFSLDDRSWCQVLHNALRYLVKTKRPPFFNDGNSYHVDLGIVVALDEELKPILNTPSDWKEVVVPHDITKYWIGNFKRDTKQLSVVACCAPMMGMPTASVLATKLISAFRPKYLAMAGICAGVKDKSDFGDIVIADPCFDWGSGKWREVENSDRLEFKPAAYQWRLDTELRARIDALGKDTELLAKIRKDYDGDRPERAPKVLIDAMASGGSVLQAKLLMEDVREQHKNLVGVDMEVYAVFTAAAYSATPRPYCFTMKSVCDFGDGDKNNKFHAYAAHCSALFLYEFALQKLAVELD